MSVENPIWGAPRIHSELKLLGYDIAESTVSKYMVRHKKPPSQSWRTFLKNHCAQTASIDFFTVPTVTFRILYCVIILCHDRRKITHFNITSHPSAQWTSQQITEAFPYDEVPKYLIRDRDAIFGNSFQKRVHAMRIKEIVTAPQSPWQNPFVERIIGTIRHDCLNHLIILNEKHLHKILMSYFDYYHHCRTHLSLEKNAPIPRMTESKTQGKVISLSKMGGLHHLYRRAA